MCETNQNHKFSRARYEDFFSCTTTTSSILIYKGITSNMFANPKHFALSKTVSFVREVNCITIIVYVIFRRPSFFSKLSVSRLKTYLWSPDPSGPNKKSFVLTLWLLKVTIDLCFVNIYVSVYNTNVISNRRTQLQEILF